jgi:hypothetical protein
MEHLAPMEEEQLLLDQVRKSDGQRVDDGLPGSIEGLVPCEPRFLSSLGGVRHVTRIVSRELAEGFVNLIAMVLGLILDSRKGRQDPLSQNLLKDPYLGDGNPAEVIRPE